MNSDFDLAAALEQRKAQSLYRNRITLESPQEPLIKVDGQDCLAFCSNDYLGLANHPSVKQAFVSAVDKYGVGSGASHLVVGHSTAHHELEERLAEFTGRDRALLFSSGYMANLGVVSALMGKSDAVLEDKLNHASLIDAGLLSGARFRRFLHSDPHSLERNLLKTEAKRKLVIADGVFSMDGDMAPLPELVRVAKQFNAWVMVDDAHGFGVLGRQGRGTVDHFNLDADSVPILMGTLGKSFGTAGAFVAGSHELIESLIQFARTYIYTTSIPPAVAAATVESLKVSIAEEWRRDKLNKLIARFRKGASELGLPLMDSATPIQPLLIGESERAIKISEQLKEKGILISAIRPPTVPKGSARLRITLSASHEEHQVDRLLSALEESYQ